MRPFLVVTFMEPGRVELSAITSLAQLFLESMNVNC